MKTRQETDLDQEQLKELKENYYLDTRYCKYIIDYIEEMYPNYYNKHDLKHLTEEKDYPLLFDAVVVAINEYESLYENMPLEYKNRTGNEGIFKTTLLSYKEIARQKMRDFVDGVLQTPTTMQEYIENVNLWTGEKRSLQNADVSETKKNLQTLVWYLKYKIMSSNSIKNYHRDYVYSSLFKNLFSTVIAKSINFNFTNKSKISVEQAKKIRNEMEQLQYDLITENIPVTSKIMADQLVEKIKRNIDLLEER